MRKSRLRCDEVSITDDYLYRGGREGERVGERERESHTHVIIHCTVHRFSLSLLPSPKNKCLHPYDCKVVKAKVAVTDNKNPSLKMM